MGQYRRHFAILLGAIVVICSTIIGVRWSKLADRVVLTELDIPRTSHAQEELESQDSAKTRASVSGSRHEAQGLLNLNAASAAELVALPGIGPVLAQNIVSYRTEHGPFSSVEQLNQVKGIGDKKLEGIRELVAVGVTPQS